MSHWKNQFWNNIYSSFFYIKIADCLKFLDSMNYITGSLAKNVQKFVESGKPLPITEQILSNYTDSAKLLLKKSKQLFPYGYITNFDVLNDTVLPPHKDFYNRLTDSNISIKDYEECEKYIWWFQTYSY